MYQHITTLTFKHTNQLILEYPQIYPVALAFDSIAFNRESVVVNDARPVPGVPQFTASVAPPSDLSVIKVRKEFPETWIWESFDNESKDVGFVDLNTYNSILLFFLCGHLDFYVSYLKKKLLGLYHKNS